MFHPGKVLKVFGPKDKDVIASDESFHALVEMWDEHVFTVLIEPRIASKIKEGDVVIVDYYPLPQTQIPKRIITKIIRGKPSEMIWHTYKAYHKRQATANTIKETMHEQQHEYMG